MDTEFAVIVPTLNAGDLWKDCLAALVTQYAQPSLLLLVDSGSTDSTVALAEANGFEVTHIDRSTFDHGGTRQMMAEAANNVRILVFLTQDAILADNLSLRRLVDAFQDPKVVVAYGRQLPRPQANPLEAHARLYNYPESSEVRSGNDIDRLGIRAAFCSNSFAAYRRDVLMELGGFPRKQIMIEDSIVAAKALLDGWKVAYVAEATAIHSHGYTPAEEFSRYFDIGVAHSQNHALLSRFGTAHNEGARFLWSELRYLSKHKPTDIPTCLVRTALKLAGYRIGRTAQRLPRALNRKLSMHKHFWRTPS